ncbi:unnamed protein product [Haemonchus placei]|uniref:Pannexin_like domain-containing protein n=1 Tax=Haemonchus placei TaxID=6290 RepID=A0A0N4WKQ3_HAEPC|nr:unnamed protein product [Haemonchus placei]
MVGTIGGDRVAPKLEDPLEAAIVQFPEQPKKITFDKLLEQNLGNFGRYQLLQFILLCLPTIFVAMHVMSWAFVAVPPPLSCANTTFTMNCTIDDSVHSAVGRVSAFYSEA